MLIKSTRVILKKKYKSIIPLENGDSSSSSSPFLGPHKYTPFAPISPVLFPSGPKRKRTTQCMSELLSDKGGETGRACVHTGPERRHSKPERRERSSNRAGRGSGQGSLSLKTLEAVRQSTSTAADDESIHHHSTGGRLEGERNVACRACRVVRCRALALQATRDGRRHGRARLSPA